MKLTSVYLKHTPLYVIKPSSVLDIVQKMTEIIQKIVLIKLLSTYVTTPSISTPTSVNIDIYSAFIDAITIPPHDEAVSINTDITMEPPKDEYVMIASRSGLLLKNNVHVIGVVIDPDYRDNVAIGLTNQRNTPYTINQGDTIAQFILEKVHSPSINIVDNLTQPKKVQKDLAIQNEIRSQLKHRKYLYVPPYHILRQSILHQITVMTIVLLLLIVTNKEVNLILYTTLTPLYQHFII